MNRELSLETGRGRRRRSQSLTSETTSIFDCRSVVHLDGDRYPKWSRSPAELSLRNALPLGAAVSSVASLRLAGALLVVNPLCSEYPFSIRGFSVRGNSSSHNSVVARENDLSHVFSFSRYWCLMIWCLVVYSELLSPCVLIVEGQVSFDTLFAL